MSARDIVLRVEHLTMRFGGLVAWRTSPSRPRRRDHRADRTQRRRQDHRVQLHHSFYNASEGRIALIHGDGSMWEALDAVTEGGTRRMLRPGGAIYLLERMPNIW